LAFLLQNTSEEKEFECGELCKALSEGEMGTSFASRRLLWDLKFREYEH